jgi:hypothetical protein
MINLLKGSVQRLFFKQAFHCSTNDMLYDRAVLASKIIREIRSCKTEEIDKSIQTHSLKEKIMAII